MARLLGSTSAKVQEDRLNVALEAASRWDAHVVLKGFHTIVAAPDGSIFVNTTGNAGLAKGGSGDVLTGVLTALTAQFGTKDWLRVLVLGVYLHGLAAELATEKIDSSGLLAGEVAAAVPQARLRLLEELRKSA
jgi:NAD(P)H-hydrate epimerase